MPALTQSSSGTSSSPDNIPGDSEKVLSSSLPRSTVGVDSLLMAAYAITELHGTAPNESKEENANVAFRSPKRKSHPTPINDQFDDADDAGSCEDIDENKELKSEAQKQTCMQPSTPSESRQFKRTRRKSKAKRNAANRNTTT
jgi:hypothetical protein